MKLPNNIYNLLNAGTAKGERLEFKAGWNPEVTPEVTTEVTTEVTVEVAPQVTPQVTPQVVALQRSWRGEMTEGGGT